MATPIDYYSDKNFLNFINAIDLTLIKHFSNMLFDSDRTKVIYSSNAYAFRKRASNNDGNLDLPFLNFRLTNYEVGPRSWWNQSAYTRGIFIKEIEEKMRIAPITLSYESSFWCHRDSELKYAFSEVNWDADNKTILNEQHETAPKPYITVNEEDISLPAVLNYEGLQFEPEYNEQDWLERNNIHSASIDFSLDTYALKTNADITIPTELILEFAYAFGEEDVSTDKYDTLIKKIIDHDNETVID